MCKQWCLLHGGLTSSKVSLTAGSFAVFIHSKRPDYSTVCVFKFHLSSHYMTLSRVCHSPSFFFFFVQHSAVFPNSADDFGLVLIGSPLVEEVTLHYTFNVATWHYLLLLIIYYQSQSNNCHFFFIIFLSVSSEVWKSTAHVLAWPGLRCL